MAKTKSTTGSGHPGGITRAPRRPDRLIHDPEVGVMVVAISLVALIFLIPLARALA